MHLLLPFYALFSLLALIGLSMRSSQERSLVWLAGWGAMLLVMTGAVTRNIRGDTGRYLATFWDYGTLSFGQMLAQSDKNILYNALAWMLAQLGSDPIWLTLPVALICLVMLRYSLRRILGPSATAVALLVYSAYPFFVFYVASGMKQALAMAFLMQAYVSLWQRQRLASLICLGIAALFHNGAALVLPLLALHVFLWRPAFGYRRVLIGCIGLLGVNIILAMTELNRVLLSMAEAYLIVDARYEIYFGGAEAVEYRTGFRWDFTLFTLSPFVAAWWLRGQGRGLSLAQSGWWLSLYALLACLGQLFAFAPYSDRFAALAWHILPLVLAVMLNDTGSRRALQWALMVFATANIALLQFYTGTKLNVSF